MHTGRSGFWIRAAAAGIDTLVLFVFAFTIGAIEFVLEERGLLTPAAQHLLEPLLLALWIAYTSLEALIGATAGKLATGIVIALADGAPAPPWSRLLRWSTKHGGLILLLLFALTDNAAVYYFGGLLNGAIAVGLLRAIDEDKRAWHDYWTHTAVVSRERAAAMRTFQREPVGMPPPT